MGLLSQYTAWCYLIYVCENWSHTFPKGLSPIGGWVVLHPSTPLCKRNKLGNKTLRGDRAGILWGCKILTIFLWLDNPFFYSEIQIYTHVGDR